MSMIANLKQLIIDRAKEIREQRRQDQLVSKAWDVGLCPYCGSREVKETSYHELSDTSYYKCKACKKTGCGESCF